MKKIDKEKLKEIGKKIGIFITVVFVFFSWFLMGVRYGRNHPKNNTTAFADDSVIDLEDKQTFYVPLTVGYYSMYVKNQYNNYTNQFGFVSPSTYLILKDGSEYWTIGSYGQTLNSLQSYSLDLETGNNTSVISFNTYPGSIAYENQSLSVAYEVVYNDFVDWSSISQYRIVGVTVNYNFLSDVAATLIQHKKEIIVYDINLAIGEDDTIHIKIASYPYHVKYDFYGTTVDTDDAVFYLPRVSFARSIRLDLPYNNYSIGYYDGYASGYNSGSNSTQTQAYNDGYSKGFSDGNSDGNSLRDVVKTAIETPVNMFKTILNWNFLGYNLFTLFSTIITVVLAVFIVKKLL